jgi:HAD superfamily hydrolase (TIGR01484 family)
MSFKYTIDICYDVAMIYKGIIFDIDGTAAPLAAETVSPNLQQAIQDARQSLKLSAATGRSFNVAQPIFESMDLTDPCVIMGGSVIIDPQSQEIYWEKPLDKADFDPLLEIIDGYTGDFYCVPDAIEALQARHQVADLSKVYVAYLLNVPPKQVKPLIKAIAVLPNTVAHGTPSWSKGLVDIHITHREATKGHAIEVLLDILGLKTDEVIGVGDSGNDLPLFLSVGHKVAVGNATEELKAKADEIAPSVDDDGLATIIRKYSL